MYAKDPPIFLRHTPRPVWRNGKVYANFYSKQALPTTEELDDFTRDKGHKLIIVEELMHEVMRNKDMELLFTQGTHHKCVSVILITQNLYPGGKHARTIALNTWYMCV